MPPPDAQLFSARLTPHRSLTARGRSIVLGLVALISLLVSLPFFLIGAWPVAGFFGLDVLLLWLAFHVCHRNALEYEDIAVTHVELFLRRVSPKGLVQEWRFNPLWVKFKAGEPEAGEVSRLALAEGSQQTEFGRFLNAGEKAEFARALNGALHEAKRGRNYP